MDEKKKSFPWLPFAVILVVILGPFALFFLIPGLIIYLVVKSKGQEGPASTPSQRYLAKNPQRRQRFEGKDEVFANSEGGEHRDNPFESVQEKLSFKFGKAEKHEFGSHVHTVNDDHSRARRLEQLEILKGAGLYTEKEYRDRKTQIIRETEP